MIIVDNREFKSKVAKKLFENDITLQPLQLIVGDYLIGCDICVERKSVADFVDSLIDKRLFAQLTNMRAEYKVPVLIIEGGESVFSVRKVHPNAIRGLIVSIIVDYRIPIIFSRDESETADYLITLLKRLEKEPKPILKKDKKLLNSDVQESIVQSIPGIGVKTGKKLLKGFKTVKSLFNAGLDDLRRVGGLGDKNAEEVFKVANEEYE